MIHDIKRPCSQCRRPPAVSKGSEWGRGEGGGPRWWETGTPNCGRYRTTLPGSRLGRFLRYPRWSLSEIRKFCEEKIWWWRGCFGVDRNVLTCTYIPREKKSHRLLDETSRIKARKRQNATRGAAKVCWYFTRKVIIDFLFLAVAIEPCIVEWKSGKVESAEVSCWGGEALAKEYLTKLIALESVSSTVNVPDWSDRPEGRRLVACGFAIIIDGRGVGPIGDENLGAFNMIPWRITPLMVAGWARTNAGIEAAKDSLYKILYLFEAKIIKY